MDEQTWLAERRQGITGSDIAAICGLSPFRSAYAVYLDKLGLIDSEPETIAMRRGTAMENFIAAEYCRINECHVIEPDPKIITHPQYTWAKGSPDRYVIETDDGLEMKDVGSYMADRWGESMTGDLDASALLQSHWYMGVSCRPAWNVAAIIEGNDYRQYRVLPDPELFGQLIEIADKFRTDHILKRCPPPVVGTERELTLIKRQFPTHTQDMLNEPEQAAAWASIYLNANTEIKRQEERRDLAKATLTQAIGSTAGILGETFKATWKQAKDSKAVDWKGLALSTNPIHAQIEAFTDTKPGSRRFLCNPIKEKK